MCESGDDDDGRRRRRRENKGVENWNLKTTTNLVPIIQFVFGKIPQTKSSS